MRLCANSGCHLHLIHPLGFALDDKRMRRAGLDYRQWSVVHEYPDYASCLRNISAQRIFACSTKGAKYYADVKYKQGDGFIFGPETRGLPDSLLSQYSPEAILRIPMLANGRSLNLSNSVAIVIFEAWRQNDFKGAV